MGLGGEEGVGGEEGLREGWSEAKEDSARAIVYPYRGRVARFFFFEFFLKKKTFLPYNCLTCAFMSAMTFFFKFFSSL